LGLKRLEGRLQQLGDPIVCRLVKLFDVETGLALHPRFQCFAGPSEQFRMQIDWIDVERDVAGFGWDCGEHPHFSCRQTFFPKATTCPARSGGGRCTRISIGAS
jgi:hypothetical protein